MVNTINQINQNLANICQRKLKFLVKRGFGVRLNRSNSSESACESTFCYCKLLPLRKQIYSNILKILPPKTEVFQIKILIFFLFLLKTQIMGTCQNRLGKAVQTSTHNLCFSAEIRKIMYLYKIGFNGVNIIQACFRDGCLVLLLKGTGYTQQNFHCGQGDNFFDYLKCIPRLFSKSVGVGLL